MIEELRESYTGNVVYVIVVVFISDKWFTANI